MFVLLLSLVACICHAQVVLDLKALDEKKIKLTGLNVEEGSKQVDTYTFEPDAWMVITGDPDRDGDITTHQYQFVEKDADSGKLVFQGHKGHFKAIKVIKFQVMVENFQVFVPVTPVSKAEELKEFEAWKSEYDYGHHLYKGGEMLSVEKGYVGVDIPGRFTIGRIVSPWTGKRTFTAFDPKARGMFLISDFDGKITKMYEFLGIDLESQNKLVFLEAGTHNSVRDVNTIKFKALHFDDFVKLIRKNDGGHVAVPVQNVGMDDYFVEYMITTLKLNSDGLGYGVGKAVEKNYQRGGRARAEEDAYNQARAREDADYYRYGGYAYDGERDYAYDYYEDEEEDEEYNAYGQGFEAGYRAALEIVMNK